jgi:membrane associated rhomboid family serine protease
VLKEAIMFPIGDSDAPNRRFPIMTYALIAINVLVFLYELSLSAPQLERFFQVWGAVPRDISNAVTHPAAAGSLHALLTLVTSQFLHAGWLHIIGNMLFLYVFGDDIEDTLGSVLFLLFYLICGIVAGLVQTFVLARMFGAANEPGIGASGAIAGALGAYIVMYPSRAVTVLTPVGTGRVSAFVLLGVWFLEQFFAGITALTPGAATSNIGFWAHIGGFIAGLLLILPFRGRARTVTGLRRRIYNP